MSTKQVKKITLAEKMRSQKEQKRKRRAVKRALRPRGERKPGNKIRRPIETSKQFRADVRNSSTTTQVSTGVDLDNQQRAIVITQPVSVTSVAGLCIAYISYAMQSGYMAETINQNNPYYAFNYVLNILLTYMQGTQPQVTTLPIWLLRLCHAVSPKTVPMLQGLASYAWDFTPNTTPTSGTTVGPTSFEYVWNPWLPGSTASGTDGFPVCQDPGAYSVEAGAEAWSELTQFMKSKGTLGKIHEIVPLNTETGYEMDASAFCVNFSNTGGGQNATGGFGTTVSLEVPIFNPIFGSLYTPLYNQPAAENRYPVWDTAFSGDTVWTGGYLSGIGAADQIGYKRAARFHFVDFNEFLDTIAQWLTQLITSYVNDPEFSLTVGTAPQLSCPLSLQEVALLLRNVMMQAFKESQPSVQSLYPALPSSGTDNQFVAFLAASNTCFLGATPMQLPQGFVENIRALVMRCVESGNATGSPANGTRQPLWFVPVLGIFNGDLLNQADYYVDFDLGDEGQTAQTFTNQTFMYENILAKDGTTTKKSLTNDVIGFVDGYDSFQNAYIQINDPMRLNQLAEIWNTWLNSWPSMYSSQLTMLGTEGGINVLTSVSMTRYWTPLDGTNRLRKVVRTKKYFDSRLQKKKFLTNTIYSERLASTTTSQSVVLSAPWEQIQSTWILPVMQMNTTGPGQRFTFFTRIQGLTGEPFSVPTSNGDDGLELSFLHGQFAARMVKGRSAQTTDWDKFFAECAALGRGGILSGLAAAFLGSVAGPTVGAIASAVADVLPI